MSKDQMHTRLIEILRRRFQANEGKIRHSIIDFRHEFGSVSSALLYATLFVPNFLVISDSVILDDGSFDLPSDFLGAQEAWIKSLEELEVFVNWRELPQVFANKDTNMEECRVLAEFVSDAWRARLKMLFPQREFVVRVISPAETGGDIGIEFRECRQRSLH